MKKLVVFLSVFFLGYALQAQIQDHTQESHSILQKEAKVGEQVDLVFEVDIDADWYIYSSEFEAEGPIKTGFTFKANPSYQLVGDIKAIHPKTKYDDIWEGNISYHEKKAEFKQTVRILQKELHITGSFEFQTCSHVTGQCLPPEAVDFKFTPKDIAITDVKEEKTTPTGKEEETAQNTKEETENSTQEEEEEKIAKEEASTKTGNEEKGGKKEKVTSTLAETEKIAGEDEKAKEISLGYFLFLAFGGGLIALLTPCVFPMIPMTVSFFTRKSKKKEGLSKEEVKQIERKEYMDGIKKATFYGLSIITIYTLIGTILSAVMGPTFANQVSTAAIPNLIFFAIFIIFAMSFLGMFEIVLPSSWVNSADRQADKGGYYGIFFMAMVLALVSFSCTGPIVGNLLVQASRGGIVRPALGMLAFSSAVAIPFMLFAIFPSWLSNLPHSGGWLNSVKVVLGFLELALAFKFLSIADQSYHWGILDRDVNLAIWIVVFTLLGFYLLGKLHLPHDSKVEKTSVPGLILAVVSFSFAMYLIPGLFGAPLKSLAGFLPPETGQDFNLTRLEQKLAKNERKLEKLTAYLEGSEINTTQVSLSTSKKEKAKYSDFLKLPHELDGFFDYEEGLAYAKKVNKPIFIDFTGHGCVNCREMEARVWSEAPVLERLQEDYVVIALYIDDRTLLPEKEWITSSYDQKIKKTIGAKNADFQITRFDNNAQPYYCLLNHKGELLAKPKAYDLNTENFINFLDKGIKKFKEQNILAQK